MKEIVVDILIPNSAAFTISPNIYYIKFRYTQQSTMFTWVMWGILSGMGPLSDSNTITNNFSRILRGKVADLFISRSTSTIINSYIPPIVTIIKTSVSPLLIIIITDLTLQFFINISLYNMRINW